MRLYGIDPSWLVTGTFDATTHRVSHRVRLLANLFEHVMRVIALLNVFRAELDFADRMLPNRAFNRADFKFVSLERNEVEII